ncbi:MAG TPA: hypothetical protein VG944_15285 [Fimbriimonas sp.]|nr:hypothetical protein [Fimbriimonas sp.]
MVLEIPEPVSGFQDSLGADRRFDVASHGRTFLARIVSAKEVAEILRWTLWLLSVCDPTELHISLPVIGLNERIGEEYALISKKSTFRPTRNLTGKRARI